MHPLETAPRPRAHHAEEVAQEIAHQSAHVSLVLAPRVSARDAIPPTASLLKLGSQAIGDQSLSLFVGSTLDAWPVRGEAVLHLGGELVGRPGPQRQQAEDGVRRGVELLA